MIVAEVFCLRYTKFFTNQDCFFENKFRLNSSKILFSFFAIIIILEHNYSSTSIASMKSAYSASNSLIFLIVISFLLEASINSVVE